MMEQPLSGLERHLISAVVLVVLLACFFVGIWIRKFVLAPRDKATLRQQLVAGIPVGLLTISSYAGPASERWLTLYDVVYALGYAMVLGMVSRDLLGRLMTATASDAQVQVPRAPAG